MLGGNCRHSLAPRQAAGQQTLFQVGEVILRNRLCPSRQSAPSKTNARNPEMRWKNVLTFFLSSLAAFFPWTARAEPLQDARHERRQQAAEILRNALRASADPAPTEIDIIELYRAAVSRAIQVAGPNSRAANQLTRAVAQADGSDATSQARLQILRRRIEELSDRLSFAPIIEAEMPQGFPPPTPVGEIELKRYPTYRTAEAVADESGAFWTLFDHIKRHKIAMTAPVEISYQSTDAGESGNLTMRFLYGNLGVGQTGSEGSVRVLDLQPQTVLSIGVRGDRTAQNVASARAELMKWIGLNSVKYRPAGGMRIMGYNSPFVPPGRRYFEVQIPITVEEPSTVAIDLRGDFDISNYLWKNRMLLVFTPSLANTPYSNLRRMWVEQSDAVAERDLVFVEILEQGESRAGGMRLAASTAAKLREQFEVDPGVATFILVGKDGTVKLRRPDVRISDLFDLIDAMPMRRAEMRQNAGR